MHKFSLLLLALLLARIVLGSKRTSDAGNGGLAVVGGNSSIKRKRHNLDRESRRDRSAPRLPRLRYSVRAENGGVVGLPAFQADCLPQLGFLGVSFTMEWKKGQIVMKSYQIREQSSSGWFARSSRWLGALAGHAKSDSARLGIELPLDPAEVMRRLQWQPASRPSRSISTIAVVTRNRSRMLERCLSSYLQNTRDHEHSPHIVVVDDSDPVGEADNLAKLAQLGREYGVAISHAGRARRAEYASRIACESGVPESLCRFALLGVPGAACSTGGSRNAVLLNTTGELIFSADDDTVCRPQLSFGAGEGLTFESKGDPRVFQFFKTPHQALTSCIDAGLDVLGKHGATLGASAAACLDPASTRQPSFENADAALLHTLAHGEARVLASIPGIAGDSGMGGPTRMLWLRGQSFRNLTASPTAYRNATTTRQVTRRVQSLALSNHEFCMTTFIGLDNRDLLPPFSPSFRIQDGLWGATLRRTHPHALTAYLPMVLQHIPEEARSFAPGEVAGLPGSRVNNFLRSLVHDSPSSSVGSEAGMRSLGRHLSELAAAPRGDFLNMVATLRERELCRRIVTLGQALQRPGTLECWANDVRRHVSEVELALKRKATALPIDLPNMENPDAAGALLQSVVCDFGKLLGAWGEIVQASRNLKNRGESLAVPVR